MAGMAAWVFVCVCVVPPIQTERSLAWRDIFFGMDTRSIHVKSFITSSFFGSAHFRASGRLPKKLSRLAQRGEIISLRVPHIASRESTLGLTENVWLRRMFLECDLSALKAGQVFQGTVSRPSFHCKPQGSTPI